MKGERKREGKKGRRTGLERGRTYSKFVVAVGRERKGAGWASEWGKLWWLRRNERGKEGGTTRMEWRRKDKVWVGSGNGKRKGGTWKAITERGKGGGG